MSNDTVICITDKDCRLGLHCFFDKDTDADICGCGGYYGWEGVNCTELGPITGVYITSCVIQVILATIGLVLWLNDINYLWKEKTRIQFNAKMLSWMYSAIGFLLFIVWRINEIYSASTPEKNTFFPGDSGHFEKAHENVFLSRIPNAIIYICTINGLLVLGVLWIEVAYMSDHMIVDKQDALIRFKRLVDVLQVIFAVIVLTCVISARYSLLVYLVMPWVFLICITYVYGKIKFSRIIQTVLDGMSKSGTELPVARMDYYKTILGHVKIAATLCTNILVVAVVFATTYAIQDAVLPNFLLGNFPIGMLSAEVVFTCVLLILLVLGWYSRQSFYLDQKKIDAFSDAVTSKANTDLLTTDAL